MKNIGYTKLWDVDCVCSDENDLITIYPVNRDDLFSIKHLKDEFFFIEFSCYNFKTISKIKQISKFDDHFIVLKPQYTLRKCIEYKIVELEMSGESLDDFFSPSRYFYNYDENSSIDKINNQELLYKSFCADSWEINVDGKQAIFSLNYGDILTHGILSKGKLSPKINIKFEETNDYDFVYRLIQIVANTLKIFGYCNEVGTFDISVFSIHNDRKSYNCKLQDYANYGKYLNRSFLINYITCKDYIADIMQFVANEVDFSATHFQRQIDSITSDCYSHLDFINIYNAFEKECHKNKTLYIDICEDKYRGIKNTVKKVLEEVETKTGEKEYLNAIKSYAGGYGNSLGQKKRIVNSYDVFKDILNNSLDSIFYSVRNISNATTCSFINKVAKHLVEDLRNGIFHGDFYMSFNQYDSNCIRFLEIIVFCQMLKRAKLKHYDIEKIIGAIFSLNNLMIDELLNKTSK